LHIRAGLPRVQAVMQFSVSVLASVTIMLKNASNSLKRMQNFPAIPLKRLKKAVLLITEHRIHLYLTALL